jgi:tetratricopeptide (TPR) repeat protein
LSDVAVLNPEPTNRTGQAIVNALRASALLGLHRESEAKALIATVDGLSPTEPIAREMLFEGALQTDHFDVAADSIDSLIDRAPDAARNLDWNFLRYFFRNEPKDQDERNDDRRIALVRIGYGADGPIGRSLALDAVKILSRRGDVHGASDLLKDVNDPEAFENLLIQKRYSALWPKIEELGGAHLALVRAAALASAEKAYQAAPDDMEKLQDYVDALRHAGRFNDAIALRAKLPATVQAMAAADEKTGWVVNDLAYAFNEAGRADEGDQLFAMLNDPPRTDARWRVSMFINRLEMLTAAGKFQKAASLLDATELSAKNDGNQYAQQLVRRLRYCILSSLGHKDEAAKALPDMLKHADDALEPTVEGLICAGNLDKAEQLALQAMSQPDKAKRERFEEQFVRALQPVPLTNDDPSVWEKSWSSLRSRPAIAAAFDRLGRDLPATLLAERRK